MNVTLRSPEDRELLRKGAATRTDPKKRDRFRAVLHALEGMEANQIALKIKRVRRFVQTWVYRYRDGGVEALADKPHTGKPCKLTPEEQQAFRQRILNGPTDADGQICTLRGPEAKRILEVEFGKKYHLGAVYALMHRLRLSPLRPASRHPKNDPKAMADWLERAPFLSRR